MPKRRVWINTTPVGRMGFGNYRSALAFCKHHNIEVPTYYHKDTFRGRYVKYHDWAAVEEKYGAKIRKMLLARRREYATVAKLAHDLGLRPYAVRAILRQLGYKKTGGIYLFERKDEAKVIIDIATVLEKKYQKKRGYNPNR